MQTLEDDLVEDFISRRDLHYGYTLSNYLNYSRVVCLTDFEIGDEVIRHPHCSHIFHPSCIRNWLELHDSCPICRTPLRGDPGSNAAEPESGSARNNQEIYEPISPTGEVNVINEPELD